MNRVTKAVAAVATLVTVGCAVAPTDDGNSEPLTIENARLSRDGNGSTTIEGDNDRRVTSDAVSTDAEPATGDIAPRGFCLEPPPSRCERKMCCTSCDCGGNGNHQSKCVCSGCRPC